MVLCPGIFLIYEVRFKLFDAVVAAAFKEVDFAAYRRDFSWFEGTRANRLVHAAPGVVALNREIVCPGYTRYPCAICGFAHQNAAGGIGGRCGPFVRPDGFGINRVAIGVVVVNIAVDEGDQALFGEEPGALVVVVKKCPGFGDFGLFAGVKAGDDCGSFGPDALGFVGDGEQQVGPIVTACDIQMQTEVGVFEDTCIVVQCFLRYMIPARVLARVYGFKHVPLVEPEVHG